MKPYRMVDLALVALKPHQLNPDEPSTETVREQGGAGLQACILDVQKLWRL
jgi:hypothetical protein